jgi:predicted transcriptional regulator
MHRGYTCVWRKIWSSPVLTEPGRRFSRLEAWLYITNALAAGKNDPDAGLKRGEFVASIRQLAEGFNWSRSAVHRFLEVLLENSMIMRVVRETGHSAGQEAGHFIVCNYETYNSPRNAKRNAERNTYKEVFKESIKNIKDTHSPAARDACVSPKILLEIYQQNNQALPGVKALTAERLRKCRSRISQAVRDGCLEQYLADFLAAVKKAQQTPFLRGEGTRGWRASFDWFVTNQVNVYAVLEGKYDGAVSGPSKENGGSNGGSCQNPECEPGGTSSRRTSRGDLIYVPRQ